MAKWRNTAERMELESVLARRKAARAWREKKAMELASDGPQVMLMSLNEAAQYAGLDVVRAALRDGVLEAVNTKDYRGRQSSGIWLRRSHVVQVQTQGKVFSAHELVQLTWTMRQGGATYRAIGDTFGFSAGQARVYVQREVRRLRYSNRRTDD